MVKKFLTDENASPGVVAAAEQQMDVVATADGYFPAAGIKLVLSDEALRIRFVAAFEADPVAFAELAKQAA